MFIEINNLKKSFGSDSNRVEVLRGVDFSIEKGDICVLLGPSGSGKSTLLNIIGGIDDADAGYISIGGERMADMNEKKLTAYRRKHLGYVFQMYNLIPNLTVRENIEVGAYLSDRPLDVDELLQTLGLYEHRKKLPNQLSGGQQQRNGNRKRQLSKIRIFCSAMSRQELWIITRQGYSGADQACQPSTVTRSLWSHTMMRSKIWRTS